MYVVVRHMQYISYLFLIKHSPRLGSLFFRILQHLVFVELEFPFHTFTLFTCRFFGSIALSVLFITTLQTHHGFFKLGNRFFLFFCSSLQFLLLSLPLPSLIFLPQPLDLFPLRKQIANSTLSAKDVTVRGACYGVSGDLKTELARTEWQEGVS